MQLILKLTEARKRGWTDVRVKRSQKEIDREKLKRQNTVSLHHLYNRSTPSNISCIDVEIVKPPRCQQVLN